MCCVFAVREEKKKKQKQEALDAEERSEKVSSGGSAVEQAAKGGTGPSQQPPKRGQKVLIDCVHNASWFSVEKKKNPTTGTKHLKKKIFSTISH